MTDDLERIVKENIILHGLVGSTAHGTGLDGHEDRDEMAVFIEPPKYRLGLEGLEDRRLETVEWRTAPKGAKSGPDDVDFTAHSLRKFCRLCAKGNPSMLLLLWLPEYIAPPLRRNFEDISRALYGSALVNLRDAFVSREAGWRFLGYLKAQRAALTGEREPKVRRTELALAHGYDTKYAMHALRLGFQGVEFLTEGRISVPVPEPQREFLRSVRRGELALENVLHEIDKIAATLQYKTETSPRHADTARIDAFLVETYRRYWEERGY